MWDESLGRVGRSRSYPNVSSLNPRDHTANTSEETDSTMGATGNSSFTSHELEYCTINFILQINSFRVGNNLQVIYRSVFESILFKGILTYPKDI